VRSISRGAQASAKGRTVLPPVRASMISISSRAAPCVTHTCHQSSGGGALVRRGRGDAPRSIAERPTPGHPSQAPIPGPLPSPGSHGQNLNFCRDDRHSKLEVQHPRLRDSEVKSALRSPVGAVLRAGGEGGTSPGLKTPVSCAVQSAKVVGLCRISPT
jgi:hypothetical protein